MPGYDLLDFYSNVVSYTEHRLDRGRIDDPIEMIVLLRLVTLEIRAHAWPEQEAPSAHTYARRAEELATRIAVEHNLQLHEGLEEAIIHWIGIRGARRFCSRLPVR